MKNFHYLIENFFTHKDYLVSAELIPGTMYTPLHLIFESIILVLLLVSSFYVAKHKDLILPSFKLVWGVMVVWEVVIVAWESLAGKNPGMDFVNNLSLYPCSIFLYTMPFIIWGQGIMKRISYGYLFTLGMMGGLINIVYPVSRLTTYSCISFVGFHTIFYHSAILFVFLVSLLSGLHSYRNVRHAWELLLPSAASLVVSIPANIVNFSPIHADYMYFRGTFSFLSILFDGVPPLARTLLLYLAYIVLPASFYLPSYLSCHFRQRCRLEDFMFAFECIDDEENNLVCEYVLADDDH